MPDKSTKTIDRACGCKCSYVDAGDDYEYKVEWCHEHEQLASVLRRIVSDFELIIADQAKGEKQCPSRQKR